MSGPIPCDGCRHRPRCESELLACERLVIFRRVSEKPARWSYAPRLPSHDLYLQAQRPVESAQTIRRRARNANVDEVLADKALLDDWEE